jgi:hypothetical protein
MWFPSDINLIRDASSGWFPLNNRDKYTGRREENQAVKEPRMDILQSCEEVLGKEAGNIWQMSPASWETRSSALG